MSFMPLRSNNIKFFTLNSFSNNLYALYQKKTDYGLLKGIVCLWNLDSDNKINLFLHEKTIAQKVAKYSQSFIESGTQQTPLLLTYDTTDELPDIAEIVSQTDCILEDEEVGENNNIFKYIIEDKNKEQITKYLQQIQEVYLIDGHHRYEAAKNLAKLNGLRSIVVMLVAKKNLFLDAFHRIIKINNELLLPNITKKILKKFNVEQVPDVYIPRTNNYFGMYLGGFWYQLRPKDTSEIPECNSENLTRHIIKPIFTFCEENPQLITYVNSRELLNSSNLYADSIVFSLFPLSMEKYINYSRNKEFLPPHTTCFLPKPISQCLVYNHFV